MTQKDESPTLSEGPYWSEELLAVLVVGLGDETQARETLEGIIQQALAGRALQGISEEALASYLSNLYERIAESVQDSDVARRRSLTKKVEVVTEAAHAPRLIRGSRARGQAGAGCMRQHEVPLGSGFRGVRPTGYAATGRTGSH